MSDSPSMESTTDDAPHDRPAWRWMIAVTVSFAALLEIIDTSIVNVALPHMQGNLGATLSEIGWVVTGYAIANAIIIPLSAWLSDVFGRKGYFVFSLIGFVASSVMCGVSTNLTMLVVSRILQGLTGGGLLAKAQSILFETFPPKDQGLAQALFGVGVLVGPVIGPTLGGYLTDTLGWRWIFFINIPFGALAIFMACIFLPRDQQRPQLAPVDWSGIALLIVALGSVQTVLEEGNQEDWFSSPMIVMLSIVGVLGLITFIWHELKTRHPAVDLRVLRHRSLAAGSILSMLVGMGLYGAMFAIPIFLQSLLNYTAMQTGMVMAPSAVASALMMPVLGQLSNKIDPRILITIGAIGTSAVMFQLSNISPASNAEQFFWPLILRGIFMVFLFMPLNLATIGPLPKADIPAATGFYNLTRQLGGSIGVALLTTFLSQRENFHRSVLVEKVTDFNPLAQETIRNFTSLFRSKGFDATVAYQQALALIDRMLNQQAAVMSFGEIFLVVGVLFIAALPLVMLLGKPKPRSEPLNVH